MGNPTPPAPVEAGEPTDDSVAFRRCLGQFATGVTVVTARTGDQLVGMTANSFSSVSLEPPLVLWSVKRSSQRIDAFKAATHFAVNILACDQLELSRHFGQSGPDQFTGVPWSPGHSGVPLLDGAVASLECRRSVDYEGGDHLIMLGEVERYTRHDRDVLLFVQGRYGVAIDHPDAVPRAQAPEVRGTAPGPINEFLVGLMYRGFGALSAAIEEGRRAQGFTAEQSRVLAAIETYPNRTLDGLMPELYLGSNTAESAVAALSAVGCIVVDGDGTLRLTDEGRARLGALLDRARQIEAAQLAGVAAADIAGTRRVCAALIERGRAAGRRDVPPG